MRTQAEKTRTRPAAAGAVITAQRQVAGLPAAPGNSLQSRQLQASQELLDGSPQAARLNAIQMQAQPNRTGLPDQLKAGIEHLSGMAMDGVRVHYNSARPAQLQALAYAQGNDIHLAPGQERHLPHEAWHVVQQKQGRVRPTLQLKGNIAVNDEIGLEREADVMGSKAVQGKFAAKIPAVNYIAALGVAVAQRVLQQGAVVPMGHADMAKLTRLIAIANTAHGLDADAAGMNVNIDITSPGRTQISPAQTSTAGHLITVEIQRAYFELASLGELLGMIAHEVGVHSYADLVPGVGAPGGPWHAVPSLRPGRMATGYVMGAENRHVSDDHLDVAQVLTANPVQVRGNKYVQTILYHGDAIAQDGSLTPAEKVQAQGELISSYCFDIARIVATDDRMAHVPAHWDAIREVYALAYTFLQRSAVGKAAWFAAAPLKRAVDLKPDFNSMGIKFVWKKLIGR